MTVSFYISLACMSMFFALTTKAYQESYVLSRVMTIKELVLYLTVLAINY